MKKTVLKLLCFHMVLLALILGACRILRFHDSDGIYSMENFYAQEPGTVDALFLGSSRAFENVDTGVLWDEQGISSYLLCGSVQPMWNTYYFLKEAYKSQNPKVVVIDGYFITTWADYHDHIRVIKNTYGMKWSPDRIRAILASAPPEEALSFLLPFIQYHSRYSEPEALGDSEHKDNEFFRNWKGYLCNSGTQEVPRYVQADTETTAELWPKSEEYFRKTLELAKSHGSEVLVVISPYCDTTEWQETAYNTCGRICEEYGASFLNFNADPDVLGLDYAADFSDNAHFNFRGAAKYASYLGRWLREAGWDLPDHRGDARFDSWEKNARYLERYRTELSQ